MPLVDKLQIVKELHFVFRRFLASYVCPSGRDQPSSQHLYELLPRMRAFLANPQQKVPTSRGCGCQLWCREVLQQCGCSSTHVVHPGAPQPVPMQVMVVRGGAGAGKTTFALKVVGMLLQEEEGPRCHPFFVSLPGVKELFSQGVHGLWVA